MVKSDDQIKVYFVTIPAHKFLSIKNYEVKLHRRHFRILEYRSFSENFETETPMGRFALQMLGAIGELERNTIVDNVKLGMAQRSKQGRWNGGICLGYKSEAVNPDNLNDTRLVIVPDEAIIVRKIFNSYASGKG